MITELKTIKDLKNHLEKFDENTEIAMKFGDELYPNDSRVGLQYSSIYDNQIIIDKKTNYLIINLETKLINYFK